MKYEKNKTFHLFINVNIIIKLMTYIYIIEKVGNTCHII